MPNNPAQNTIKPSYLFCNETDVSDSVVHVVVYIRPPNMSPLIAAV